MEVEKDDTVYIDERNFLFYKFIVKVSCDFGGVVIDFGACTSAKYCP